MKRVKYSDIRFKVNPKLVYVKSFTMRFYTVSSRYYFFEKTEQDVIEVEREATVDDVDVILSGGTKVTEYYIPIEWDELLYVGEGVLNYRVTNNIEDPEFPDHYYNKEITVTTDFYIDCDIHVDPEPAEGLIERIVALEEHLATEIVDRETADSFISGAVDTEIARAISAETELSEALTSETSRATSAETVLDEKIDAETNRATSAETALDEKVDKEIADRIADVNAEEARAISAETVLQEALDAEETRASRAEDFLSGAIDSVSAITSGNVESLTQAIQNEASARTDADNVLSAAIDSYSASTDGKINYISGVTDTKLAISDFNTYSGRVATDIESISAITSGAVSDFQTQINNEVARATSAETAISGVVDTKLAKTDFNTYSAATNSKIQFLSGSVSSNTTAINAERQRAISAETEIISTIEDNELATSEALNDINSRLINIIDKIDDNELATSEAINDLNSRVINIVDNTYTKSEVDDLVNSGTTITSIIERVSQLESLIADIQNGINAGEY